MSTDSVVIDLKQDGVAANVQSPRRPTYREQYLDGDLHGLLLRILLDVGYIGMYLWLLGAMVVVAFGVWAAFFADPAQMAPGSLSADSSLLEKAISLGGAIGFVAMGVVFLRLMQAARSKWYDEDAPRNA